MMHNGDGGGSFCTDVCVGGATFTVLLMLQLGCVMNNVRM